MEIHLLENSSEATQINKKIRLLETLNISFKKKDSKENPTIILSISNFNEDSNYCFIPFFNRYYFISEKIYLNGSQIELHLTSDLLMTYKDSIINSDCIVTFQEQVGYIDSTIENDVREEVLVYTSTVEVVEEDTTIMVTIGG